LKTDKTRAQKVEAAQNFKFVYYRKITGIVSKQWTSNSRHRVLWRRARRDEKQKRQIVTSQTKRIASNRVTDVHIKTCIVSRKFIETFLN